MSTFSRALLYLGFLQAVVAMGGSLFFSEVMHLPPCVLCWYQRICMYPLVGIFGVGLVKEDRQVVWYAAPLVIIGWCIALFHNLLYYQLIPESLQPCTTGVSCTTKFFAWFGFITIPLMSLVAFTILLTVLGVFAYKNRTDLLRKKS